MLRAIGKTENRKLFTIGGSFLLFAKQHALRNCQEVYKQFEFDLDSTRRLRDIFTSDSSVQLCALLFLFKFCIFYLQLCIVAGGESSARARDEQQHCLRCLGGSGMHDACLRALAWFQEEERRAEPGQQAKRASGSQPKLKWNA